MFKNFLLALGLPGWLVLALVFTAPRPKTPDLSRDTPASNVLVSCVWPNGETGGGSGTILATKDWRSYVVTCKHVTADALAVTVTFADGSEAAARPEKVAETADLAVLSVPGVHPTSDVADDLPPLHSLVRNWGRTRMGPANYRCAEVTDLSVEPDWKGVTMPFAAAGGDSGSGVYDSRGRVCGVVSYMTRQTPTRCYVVPGAKVSDLLAEVLK